LRTTILNTPIFTTAVRPLVRLLLFLVGWKVVPGSPDVPKYVLIAAPHTSNWDAVLLLMAAALLRIQIFFLGKDALFPPLLAPVTRWLGGIPVDRTRSTHLVAHVARQFEENEQLIIVVPPEGTRSRSDRWKTGFYYMAVEAGVPIALGYLDYKTKRAGIGPLFYPTGSIEDDLPKIREFYSHMEGRNHQDFGEVRVER
jgi:1-acyl-sn-glycerol-3-phosphate acyltransferase